MRGFRPDRKFELEGIFDMTMRSSKTSKDFPAPVLDAFDQYVHGFIDRREFLSRASIFAIGSVTAASMLDALNPQYAGAAEVNPDDRNLIIESKVFRSPDDWNGYLVKPAYPAKKGKLPAVLVIHENRGRNPYVEDVARRLGLAGFIAFAPDGLSSLGGWPGNDEEGREMMKKLDRGEMMKNWVAAAKYLERLQGAGNVGAVGFCSGGSVVNSLATKVTSLKAGVAFYGGAPDLTQVGKIKAEMQIHHGEKDTRLLAGAPAYEAALRAAEVKFESYIYKGALHGFHNNTTPRYDESAAQLAWQRTVRFLRTRLDS
jgi:carboxymethylenebutenolidase